MKKCENCGRSLQANEETLCPACESESSHKKKKIVEIVLSVAAIGFGLYKKFKK